MPPPNGIVGRSAPHDRRFNQGKGSFQKVLGDDEELSLSYVTFPYVLAAFRILPFTGILLPPSHDFASAAPTAASAFDQRSIHGIPVSTGRIWTNFGRSKWSTISVYRRSVLRTFLCSSAISTEYRDRAQ